MKYLPLLFVFGCSDDAPLPVAGMDASTDARDVAAEIAVDAAPLVDNTLPGPVDIGR